MIKLSNDIYIYFALEKEIGKIIILKKHAETLHSILKGYLLCKTITSQIVPCAGQVNNYFVS